MPAQSIKPRKDGRYLVRYKGKPFYGYTQREAIAKREEYKRMEALGLISDKSNPLFSDYAQQWLATYKCNVAPSLKRTYMAFVKRATAELGGKTLQSITRTDVVRAYNAVAGMSGSTCRKYAMVINAIMEAAAADGLIQRNPCKGVRTPKGPDGTHRCLENWEKELVLRAVDSGHRFALAAAVMLYTGLRRGEVIALNIDEDVDFENDIVHVRRAVQFDGAAPRLSATKTDAGIRDIPLLPQLKAILKGRHGMVLPGKRDGGAVSETVLRELVMSYNNELSAMANGGIQRRWWGRTREHKALIAAGGTLPEYREVRIRCHDFRHSYCTMLYEAGIDLKTAQRWMGHADEKMILHIYAHVTDRQEQRNVEKLRAFMVE